MTTSRFELEHPAGVHITRRFGETDLISALPAASASKSDMGTGWVWYRLPPFEDAQVLVAISLGFNLGTLEMITLSDAHSRFGRTWSEWSEDKEHERASSIRSWLRGKGLESGTYPWGSVWVGYDSKGGSGSATVRLWV